jgi:hypothetical protein
MTVRTWLYLTFVCAVLLATRLPFAGGQIFSFDDINLTYAVDEFDIQKSQPQPPGYLLFVLEQRLSRLIGFKNPRSNLLWLAMAGAFASLLAMRWCGRTILGSQAGGYALWLLLFHPTFWYTTLTSALRVQLALISAVVAGACWKAWQGETRWVFVSAAILGIGAGVRPELGPLLAPLWLGAALKSGASPGTLWRAAGVLAATVLSWLIPLTVLSGGPIEYFRSCWVYLIGQDTLQTPVLGMSWRNTAVWFLVWVFSGWLLWPLMGWLGRGATRLANEQILFFALWMLPGVAFALLIHVADPGHTLALLVPATLISAHQVSRAATAQALRSPSRWDTFYPVALLGPLVAMPFLHPGYVQSVLLALCLLGAALIPRIGGPRISPAAAAGFVLAPYLALFVFLFGTTGWYSKNPGNFSFAELRSHINSGIAMSTLDHYQTIIHADDTSIRTIWSQTEGHAGPAFVLWERGLTEPRKLAYYVKVPVLWLESSTPVRPGPPLFTQWMGNRRTGRDTSASPLRVPLLAGARLLWMVLPKSPLAQSLPSVFPGMQIGDVYVSDLPSEPGERRAGDFLFVW